MSALFAAMKAVGIAGGLWACYGVAPTCYYKYVRKKPKLAARMEEAADAPAFGAPARRLALTFDDGPDPRYTPRLLDDLAKENVKAIFFVLTPKAQAHPELIRRMLDEGHLVGFHGLSHRGLWGKGLRGTAKNFLIGLDGLRQAGCADVRYFRPPYGNLNLFALRYLKRVGLELMLWDVMVQDWRADTTPALLVKKLKERVRDGSVICLHDSGEGSAAPGAPERMMEALRSFIPEMKAAGWRFVLPAGAKKTAEKEKDAWAPSLKTAKKTC